ncbi:MAG: sulfatase-like hydrolase/transferase [Bacilli bacterium]
MKKLQNSKTILNFILLLLSFLGIELIFRLASGIKVFDVSILRVILGSLIISILFTFLLSWINKKVSKIIIVVITFIFSIYSFLQLGFNNFLGVYISVNTSSQLGAVMEYIKEFFASFYPRFYLIFIPVIILSLFLIWMYKFLKTEESDKKFILKKKSEYENVIRTLKTCIILIVFCFLYYQTLSVNFMQNELQSIKTKDLFHEPNVPSIVVNEFGVLGFGFLDIKSLYVKTNNSLKYHFDGEKNNNDTTRVYDDTLWNEVIESEENETNKLIGQYLINNKITDVNEKTGVFEGKNLIIMMMESVNDIFINPEYYPNFYNIYSNGWSFKNNYSPRNSCPTGNNEFSGLSGLYSIYNTCTSNIYKDNVYSTGLFNLFKNKGYNTVSMHDYTEAYYYRNTIHTNLGSSHYYGVEELGIPYFNEYRNWASDEDFANAAMNIMVNGKSLDNPFMMWMTSVSSHQPYIVPSVEGDKYIEMFQNTGYPIDLQRYMSKLKTLDNSLGIILESLKNAGILDDTVILLFGDHYPYGLTNETINNVLNYDLSDYEVEKTPFVIYNSATSKEVIDDYTSYMNIAPTVANLFNLDFDPRLYMGEDLFNPDYKSLVVFADGSWKNEFAYYNAASGTIKYFKEDAYTVDEIKEINNNITLKMQMSTSIIKNNYFYDLDVKIKELKMQDELLASE